MNVVAPGPVYTNMLNIIPQDRQIELKQAAINQRFAHPEEVAEVIYWLANECPEHVNGVCVDINSGAYLR